MDGANIKAVSLFPQTPASSVVNCRKTPSAGGTPPLAAGDVEAMELGLWYRR